MGGGAVGVVPRAVVRDMMTGAEATRMMAAITLVFSVLPMLDPLAGSAWMLIKGWRGSLGALLIAAMVSLALLVFAQPETLPPENRRPFNPRAILRGCGDLSRDRGFMLWAIMGACGFGSFFLFLASASCAYPHGFGLSSKGFALAFAANAMSFILSRQMASSLSLRFGVLPMLK
ncbi:MAG: MFS transporter [Alphaproteobacteria bacterium]